MLRHYLKVAARGLISHKLYSFINALGLAVALTCVILFVRYQLSYDKWIPGTQSLYRVEFTVRVPGVPAVSYGIGPYPLGTALHAQIPGVTGATRLLPATLTLAHGGRQFLEKHVDFVDENFFRMIRLPFLDGVPDSALRQPESVVLSESAAKKYFGDADPMGRSLIAGIGSCPRHDAACRKETVALRVTGIVRNLPENTQLRGAVFIPMTSPADPYSPKARQSWLRWRWVTYIGLRPGVKPADILSPMQALLDQDITPALRKAGVPSLASRVYSIHVTPFTHVHLNSSRLRGNLTPPGSWSIVCGVMIIGGLIFLIACFNFTNLATARAALRAREVGLRKTLGATRRRLAVQSLSEAVSLALLSLVCAAVAAQALLPALNGFLHQSSVLDYVHNWRLDLMLIGIAVGAGLVSGIYPALILSRPRPVAALQVKTPGHHEAVWLRDGLVFLQFAVSIGLGIAVIVVFRQISYARNMELGFRQKDIVVVRNSRLTGRRQKAFVRALRANAGVREVGMSNLVPFGDDRNIGLINVRAPGRPSQVSLQWMVIGPDYPRAYGIALAAGRLLSASRGKDRFSNNGANAGHDVLVNVAAARKMGFTPREAVGRTILIYGGRASPAHIVGVLEDARTQGAREPVAPTIYLYYPGVALNFSVRLRPGRIAQTLAYIKRTWHTFVPAVAIRRTFVSAGFRKLYRADERDGTVFGIFVARAIFIACLGLYGLVIFTTERRTKEVALRKISGARTLDIMRIMRWRISVPVLLANAIAWPAAYYYLQRWLEGFADHIGLTVVYFLSGAALALLIAWATVFVHTLHIARTSPVRALRCE